MARRARRGAGGRTLQRALVSLTRSAWRAGSKALAQSLRATPTPAKPKAAPRKRLAAAGASPAVRKRQSVSGPSAAAAGARMASGVCGTRGYRLYQPPGVQRSERLPLLVMLHGCAQDAQALAASSHMNRLAARERFLVLYPEQGRLANPQACWNWYDTRAGRAQREADSIAAAIAHVCSLYPADAGRVALAGLSAGASMAALLAVRHPERFRALAMHSGVAPGVARSSAAALMAMRRSRTGLPLEGATPLPALLVIHGSADAVVASGNGAEAARLWAAHASATPGAARTVQRGARYAAVVTDYRARGRLVATLCAVQGLGHAWSGGSAGQPWSDPRGPDASRRVWAFAARQFQTLQLE